MMDMLDALHLLRPWWLLLLLPAVALWWLQRRRTDTTQLWRRVIDPTLLKHLTLSGERTALIAPGDLLLIAWVIGIVALAGPTWKREPSPFADAQPPAMIVLRVTPSMLSQDLAPTRLERAKQKISDLLGLREGAATGLIAYSGSAHLVLPPTPDKDVILSMARALSPEIMPSEGDRIADAVVLAAKVLIDDKRGGSIVVLADTVAPDQIAALAAGSRDENRPPVTLLAMAPPARVEADPSLRRAADALDARLVEAMIDQSDVDAIARRLERIGGPKDVSGEGVRWQEAGYWLTPLIALVTLGWFRRGWLLTG